MPSKRGDSEVFIAPRWTEYLRNASRRFKPGEPSVLNLPLEATNFKNETVSLLEYQKSRLNRSLNSQLKWTDIKDLVVNAQHDSKHQDASEDVDKFYAVARNVAARCDLPSSSESKTDEVAIVLLNFLLEDYRATSTNNPTIHTSHKVLSNIREYFGKLEQSLTNKLNQAFNSLIYWLDEQTYKVVKRKLQQWTSGNSLSDDEDESSLFPFGRVPLGRLNPRSFGDHDEIPIYNLIDIRRFAKNGNGTAQLSEEEKVMQLFRDSENAAMDTHQNNHAALTPIREHAPKSSAKWDRLYLLNLVGNQDVLEALLNTITSEKSNDEIQEQLFDLLGFEKLDLISSLLENRTTIMKELSREEALAMAVRNQISSANTTQSHPVIGVKVQSQGEKMLEKMYRKEERKIMKSGGSSLIGGIHPAEVAVGNAMRAKIQASAQTNRTGSAIGVELSGGDLPNVYDSYADAKQKPGFISGIKMVLPDNVTRKSATDYEEVSLPAMNTSVPASVASKELIKIADLDQLGQKVFHGMKTLNRIQTLVFETAYKTNENLLICAPTGAGKTNIALLAAAKCIAGNTTGGIINKDQFKIVYVAPMKALAAEMTANFAKRLNPLGIQVRELTGDMQLTKSEITQTQMLVTTPEKWDVVTRKSTGDVALAQIVKLLIIDEVHLLHGDRGPVVESLVARTLRQIESSQKMIRIVGLSATLPNYRDVALFLRVNPRVGLFYFDSRFRPVPLGQTFIGVKGLKMMDQQNQMDSCCYDKVQEMVSKGHQVMVFVHARNATMKTAEILIEMASKRGQLEQFKPKSGDESYSHYGKALKTLETSRNKKLAELFQYGFSMHHAGMLRSDRSLIEKLFGEGLIRVLCCTATLAWGVNLPAHAVIIKGTEIYDAKQGSFVDLGILDVLQIFGRAGRPQFDNEGHGTIITTHDKLAHYLSLLTNQFPIESSFIKFLSDNLNAEVALGSVTNIDEAVEWLTYTYLYVRMRRNPQLYGMQMSDAQDDPLLAVRRKELIVEAARLLEKCKMIRFDERTEYLHSTDMGRTASHFYIKYDTVETFNEIMIPVMSMDMILMMISKASEFDQLKVRDEELDELDDLTRQNCYLKPWGGSENIHGKVNILIQTYISRGYIKSFSLMSDQQYVIQNANRICRGFFEVVLRQNIPLLAGRLLQFSKMLDNQLWENCHPLKQHKFLSFEVMEKLEKKNINLETIRDSSPDEIGSWINHQKMGVIVKRCAEEFPMLSAEVGIQPITRTVLRMKITIVPDFKWNDRLHGNVSESFWIWVEDPESNYIYHTEYFIITKRQVIKKEQQEIIFTIPIVEPLPPQYYVRITSERFLGSEQTLPVSFKHLILPEQHPPHTDLLDLDPLPISALKDTRMELLYSKRFSFFNPIQTQIFHTLYHTDTNVLVGAPTGSGKTIAAEFAMFRVFHVYPRTKVVYIAPLKALVRERIKDWKDRLEGRLGKKVVELTGDVTPDIRAISESDVIVTTPEKWDGISRSWQTRNYVQAVSLIIIDEIHLLGEDRGPVLEVIVSRTNYISQHTKRNLRVVGLSTALANARDLADWLGIKGFNGLFNFRPSVRPVPIQVHIQGFPGKHYCPRMATMNKPTFQAIREHSPSKPVLVFVSSRRQTRLTALDLIAYLAAEGNPKQWLHIDDNNMDHIIDGIKESNLKLTLSFGIGIHHAGLQDNDRKTVEELFVNSKIQVLIATATLAWGVNFPAHLVVVKGTEYYDGKTHRYVDMPITDVLQMMGRAGRPQFDNEGVAVVLVHDQKKNFYKKFLYEPFPVESSLLDVLPDHFNAEVVAGTITTTQEALDYLTYTYFFRRLVQNPSYYELESNESNCVNKYLSNLVSKAFNVLENASCLYIQEDLRTVEPTSFGRIAAYYYLSHQTMQLFRDRLTPNLTLKDVLSIMTDVYEYAQLPVRHNEDILNEELSKSCPVEVTPGSYNSPHTKAHLLLQCYFSRVQLPSSDYYTDLKSVLDQALRILQALIDACAESGWLGSTLHCINLIQMTVQGRWLDDDALLSLPFLDAMSCEAVIRAFQTESIPEIQEKTKTTSALLEKCLLPFLNEQNIGVIYTVLQELPIVSVEVVVQFGGRNIRIPFARGSKRQWIDLPPEEDIALIFNLCRNNRCQKDLKAHASKFPKSKVEAWFIVIGDTEKQDVIVLKRTSGLRKRSQQQLAVTTPAKEGYVIYTVYLMSDCYIGLDQQYELCLNITNKKSAPPPGFD